MQIEVRHLGENGKMQAVVIDIEGSDTVGDLKQLLFDIYFLNPIRFKLYFEQHKPELKDKRALDYYELRDQSVLQLFHC